MFAMKSLREHLPLQQGLRPDKMQYCFVKQHLREHLPLQQGLRQDYSSSENG